MKIESLRRAKFLVENMETTQEAINVLENLPIIYEGYFNSYIKGDGFSNLTICKNKDGSGFNINLYRGEGNLALINVIKQELLNQLEAMKQELELL